MNYCLDYAMDYAFFLFVRVGLAENQEQLLKKLNNFMIWNKIFYNEEILNFPKLQGNKRLWKLFQNGKCNIAVLSNTRQLHLLHS